MNNVIQVALLKACARFLPAIVRLLIPNGINCRQMIELVKNAYVDVVAEEHGLNGRPANISKTAIMTGLTRADVRRIRERDRGLRSDALKDSDQRRYNFTALLSDWHLDKKISDYEGKPMDLPLEGDAPSFKALAQKHFGSVPITAVLRELKKANAVERTEDGKVRVLRDFYSPERMSIDQAERVGGLLLDFITTVEFNLHREKSDNARVEYRTTQTDVPVRHLSAFTSLLNDEATVFYQRIDRWLEDKKRYESSPDEKKVRMGFGLYQIHGSQ